MKHWRLLLTGVVLVVLVVGVIVAWPWVRIYTGSAPPEQFYHSISPVPVPTDRHVLGIAHNAGNNRSTTSAALEYGADVVEIDVTTARGVLVAGRAHGFQCWQNVSSGAAASPRRGGMPGQPGSSSWTCSATTGPSSTP